jgi:hypothetical protein
MAGVVDALLSIFIPGMRREVSATFESRNLQSSPDALLGIDRLPEFSTVID